MTRLKKFLKIMHKVDKSIINKLFYPKINSHKYENGVLLIIGGSNKFHGAPWLSIEAASRIVDLIYYSSVAENNKLMQKIKVKNPCFIAIPRHEIWKVVHETDAILLGPGLGINKAAKQLVNSLLKKYPDKKFVLDADALKLVNLRLLRNNVIVTPHVREFKILFGQKANYENARKMSKKFGCIIVLKGVKDIICSARKCVYNSTGNQGMTKGGTGDVLAGLIAALSCKNDLFLAAQAGALVNGLAGDGLYKKMGVYYNALDLAREIPRVLHKKI